MGIVPSVVSSEHDVEGLHGSLKKDPAGEISESVSSISPSHEVLDLCRLSGLILDADESIENGVEYSSNRSESMYKG